MTTQVTRLESWAASTYDALEASVLPAHGCLAKRIAQYVLQSFQFLFFVLTSGVCCLLSCAEKWLYPKKDTPLVEFAKHPPPWKEDAPIPKIPIGVATAAFHDNGPQVHHNTQFGQFYSKDHPELFDPCSHFPKVFDNPERFIKLVKEICGKSFRFSIPRDLVEPQEGTYEEDYIQKVINFCNILQREQITPMVTLEHFSRPIYQDFTTQEKIDSFVKYAEKITECLYPLGVRQIVTFNEVGVEPFQGYIMGAFPPCNTVNFEKAAQFFTNMMKAHTKVYKALKSKHHDFEIGFSHDPIRFRYFHKYHPIYSPIERLLCKILTDPNHTMVMNALKTGTVTLKIPFFCNYSVELDEPIPFDAVYLQYYTDPLIKLSLFGGESATRVPEEKISSYQFRQYPQGLASAIEEMSTFNKPIHLSEIGIDTGINKGDDDHERIAYINKIFQVVQKALDEGKPIRSLHLWTLTDNFDWHQGFKLPTHCPVRFGLYRFDHHTGDIVPRGLALWLKGKMGKTHKIK